LRSAIEKNSRAPAAARSSRSRGAGPAACAFLQRRSESLRTHRLHQVVERVQLEGLDSVAVVGGDEDDCRRALQSAEVARHLDAPDAGHLDVEQQHLRAAPRQALDHVQPIGRFADHDGRKLGTDVGQQLLEACARGPLRHRR
jgi:hypothetical protein